MAPRLGLIVIALNEEELIGDCLRSASICDELIVVDAFSTDRTVEIARGLGARIYQREFTGYIAQKQFALEQATADWVLSLDADEQLTFALRHEIEAILGAPGRADGYQIRRILYHIGHYYARGVYPDFHLRLFRREGAHFAGSEPHAKAVISGRMERLHAPMLHFSYADIADHVATMNRLTTQSAADNPYRPLTPFKMFANPAWRFFNFYILRGGFLEGTSGLYASMAAAFYVFLKYAKIYERMLKDRHGT
ncbi:MAG TPA: glycosyltransferase family 2 protein [Candidatus Binataceae bacterium]|nr:glycosyltransferase family 2 protein [Candidatus Binataceae bacterium]